MTFKIGDRVKFTHSLHISYGYRGYVTKIEDITSRGLCIYYKCGDVSSPIPLKYFTKPHKILSEL